MKQDFIEVESGCFESVDHGEYSTVIIINRCRRNKRSVSRKKDSVEFRGSSRDECDAQLAQDKWIWIYPAINAQKGEG